MRKEDTIYYGKKIEDAKHLYLKEVSFYLDITNYLLYNYESFLTYEENLRLISNIKKVNKLLRILENTLNKKNINISKVDYIMYLFNKIIPYTDEVFYKVYSDELTKIENYKQGDDFNFLVHVITRGNNRDTNNSEITSASLINEENIALFSNFDTDITYGYILEAPLDNIVVTCNADAFSDVHQPKDKKRYLKTFDKYYKYDDFEVKISPINVNGTASIAKIIPLNYLKRINVDESIDANLEKLNYDNLETYNETVLLNNEKLIKKGVFVRTLGDKSISKNYKKALDLSKKTGLKLVEIDLSLYREKNNLDFLTTEEAALIIKRFKEIVASDNDIYFAYYFSDKKVPFSTKCLNMYIELRKKEYLNEEELKEYIVNYFKGRKVKEKVK